MISKICKFPKGNPVILDLGLRKPLEQSILYGGSKEADPSGKFRSTSAFDKNKTKRKECHMSKTSWKPGNMLYPLPAVLVTCTDGKGRDNVLTVAWTGTVCSEPAMLSISIRPERYSYPMIKETGEFVVNITTESLLWAVDYCGVRSGREEDKFRTAGLTKGKAQKVQAPVIAESPVNIECRVTEVLPMGSHDMFLAKVVNVQISDEYLDEKGVFHLDAAKPIIYSHGQYYATGRQLGTFGYSVRKKS